MMIEGRREGKGRKLRGRKEGSSGRKEGNIEKKGKKGRKET